SEVSDEGTDEELLLILNTLREPDLCERAPRQCPGSQKAAMQDAPRASAYAHVACLEHFEGEQRGVEQVSHLMGHKPGALVAAGRFLIERRLILLTSEFGHRACDGVIEAPVESSEVVC